MFRAPSFNEPRSCIEAATNTGSSQMGSRLVRVTHVGWGRSVLVLEAVFVGYAVGALLHRTFPEMHGALVLTLGIVTGIVFLALVLNSVVIFWLWTAALAGGAGHSIWNDAEDKGWGLFWAAVTVLLIVGLHVYSRNMITADQDEVLVED